MRIEQNHSQRQLQKVYKTINVKLTLTHKEIWKVFIHVDHHFEENLVACTCKIHRQTHHEIKNVLLTSN